MCNNHIVRKKKNYFEMTLWSIKIFLLAEILYVFELINKKKGNKAFI